VLDGSQCNRYKIPMTNAEAMTAAFENLITMWSLPVAANRCMLAFQEDDHDMVQKTAIVYEQLLTDVVDYIPSANA